MRKIPHNSVSHAAGGRGSHRSYTCSLAMFVGLCTFVGCITKAEVKSDRQKDKLFGAVHIVRTEKNTTSGEENQGGGIETTEVTYDQNGNKTHELKYQPNGLLLRKTVFLYGSNNKLIEITTYSPDGSTYLKRARKFIKDAAGEKVEENVYKNGSTLLNRAITLYDIKGRPIELATYTAGGTLEIKQSIMYIADDNPSEVKIFDSHDSLTARIVFEYDRSGHLTEHKEFSGDGTLASRTVFSGDTVRGRAYSATQYDAKGALTIEERYVREFDSQGNWIKETKSVMNSKISAWEVVEITRRQIAYY